MDMYSDALFFPFLLLIFKDLLHSYEPHLSICIKICFVQKQVYRHILPFVVYSLACILVPYCCYTLYIEGIYSADRNVMNVTESFCSEVLVLSMCSLS